MSMNIYQKISKARIMFQESGVKQSGKNSFAGYSYFELSDILPKINKIADELGFICMVSFEKEKATLKIQDTETDISVCFESPMSDAKLKGCHDVQNLGAVETYIKRYLYQNAFEIVENDAVNGTHNPNEKPQTKPVAEDVKTWLERIRKSDLDGLEVIGKELATKFPNKSTPQSIRDEYKIRTLELAPKP